MSSDDNNSVVLLAEVALRCSKEYYSAGGCTTQSQDRVLPKPSANFTPALALVLHTSSETEAEEIEEIQEGESESERESTQAQGQGSSASKKNMTQRLSHPAYAMMERRDLV